jgi:hypothetical protein
MGNGNMRRVNNFRIRHLCCHIINLYLFIPCETSVTFCHNCGLKLLGNENFCPQCGIKLQQNKTIVDNNKQSIGVQNTTGDVMGVGISWSGNTIGKDTKGNIFYFNIQSISSEQHG